MNFDDWRRLADEVRQLPLEAVLLARGAERDRRDRQKWHTQQGPISITGPKFTNWWSQQGGGGAIDLALHLGEPNYRTAVLWLAQHVRGRPLPSSCSARPSSSQTVLDGCQFALPLRDDRHLELIRQYLTKQRWLPSPLVDDLIERQRLYADSRRNAVFLLLAGKPNRAVGAELRGTGPRVWRGMASGSRKDAGFFWIGDSVTRQIVLCESAIDAISCHAIHPQRLCISTAGARPTARWIKTLLERGYQICCGFDADQPGDEAALAMIARYPTIQRLRPPAKDWNDMLQAISKRS